MSHAHSAALTCCLLACLCYQCSRLPAAYPSLLTPLLFSCCKLQRSIYHSVRLECLSSACGFYTATDSSQFLLRDKIQQGKALQRCLLMCSRPGIHFCASLCDVDKNENYFMRNRSMNGFYSALLLFSLTLLKSLAIETLLPNHYIAVFSRLLATLFLLRVC